MNQMIVNNTTKQGAYAVISSTVLSTSKVWLGRRVTQLASAGLQLSQATCFSEVSMVFKFTIASTVNKYVSDKMVSEAISSTLGFTAACLLYCGVLSILLKYNSYYARKNRGVTLDTQIVDL